jgi:lipopolysaccharide/colanic/teichoic acid biosynthesis glycosyltransferase
MVLKPISDYIVASVLLVLLFPVMIIFSILIMLSGRGPVIFTQERVGQNGRIFRLYKFRTMKHDPGNGIHLLSGKNDNRITPLGRFMRKHKLDEIPNFFNILKGEMSLVGPRPEQKYFTEQIAGLRTDYELIKSIKPGITSWGQVRYGYASSVPEMLERLEYDLYYIRNRSFWFDLRILIMTVGIIFRGQGT